MGHFKEGSFKFAQKAGVPIVPVSIIDSYKIFEEHNTFTGGTIKVVIHPTVDISGMLERSNLLRSTKLKIL